MQVIFLDFDGVITTINTIYDANTQRVSGLHWYRYQISSELANNVRLLQEHMQAKIVISSAWRMFDSLELLRRWLSEFGNIDPESIIDTTPQRIDGSRPHEIKDWLDSHPEVTKFIILDDDESILDIPEFEKHWIKTCISTGFDNKKLKESIGD